MVDHLSPLERYAWVVDHLPRLPGSGIVYVLTVADADRLTEASAPCTARRSRSRPTPASSTHPPATSSRTRCATTGSRRSIATSALGMGYDKPDLGFVVHVGAPPSPVSYYQQVGRAGRAIDHAHAVLLPSEADAGVWDYFATSTIPVPEQVDAGARRAVRRSRSRSPAIEAESGVRRGRVELMLKQLAVDGVTERLEEGWVTTGTTWHYDAPHYDGVVRVRRREADIMRAYTRGERCLMELLQSLARRPERGAVRAVLGVPRWAARGPRRRTGHRDDASGRRGAAPRGAPARAAQDVARWCLRHPRQDRAGGAGRGRSHPGLRRRTRVA